MTFIAEYRGQQMFSVRNQIVNIFRFLSEPVSPQLLNSVLGCESILSQYSNEWVWLSSSQTLFTKTGGGSNLA